MRHRTEDIGRESARTSDAASLALMALASLAVGLAIFDKFTYAISAWAMAVGVWIGMAARQHEVRRRLQARLREIDERDAALEAELVWRTEHDGQGRP